MPTKALSRPDEYPCRQMWDFCHFSREASLRVRAHIYLSVTIISAAAAAACDDCLDDLNFTQLLILSYV